MVKDFWLHLVTPQGNCKLQADSWDDLVLMLPSEIRTIIIAEISPDPAVRLDAAARAVQRIYSKKFRPTAKNQTRIAMACLELDLIKCYLQRMMILEAVEWMKRERRFDTSKTSVGRYWMNLQSLKINDLRSW